MTVLIFDFFGVICNEIAPFVLPKYMSDEEAVRFKATVVEDTDLGVLSQAEMFERLGKIAGAPAKALEDEFWSHATIRPEMVTLIDDLRTRCRIGLLTNAIVPFVRQIFAKNDLERLFDTILISAEAHLTKPNPAFFRMMLEKMGVAAEDCVFIDDNPANIAGAAEVGIPGILFRSAEQVKIDLAERFGIR
jgi:putative hydrolase of the HAD superfamily